MIKITPLLKPTLLFVFAFSFFLQARQSVLDNKASLVWYTQIGEWELKKDTVKHSAFLFFDAKSQNAESGQATAKVRYNHEFNTIRRFDATVSLNKIPAIFGLLIQNKQTTYYFFVNKFKTNNYLQIQKFQDDKKNTRASIDLKAIPDTILISVYTIKDSLYFFACKTILAIKKPVDFDSLKWIGFECPAGKVKVISMNVTAQNDSLHETFTHANIVNLHLDKLFRSKK